jgi:hypothetical protein
MRSAPLVIADPPDACRVPRNNVTGALVLVTRGRCAFLDKAMNVSVANASAILILNRDEDIYRVSAGYGLGEKPINVTLPENITVVMLKASARPILWRLAAKEATPAAPHGRLVPLACGEGRSVCEPVTVEEASYLSEGASASGRLVVPATGERFEFVASTFGGPLPEGRINISAADPPHACGMVPTGVLGWARFLLLRAVPDLYRGYGWPHEGGALGGRLALVARGGCHFGQKAESLQSTDARGMILVLLKTVIPIGGMCTNPSHSGVRIAAPVCRALPAFESIVWQAIL